MIIFNNFNPRLALMTVRCPLVRVKLPTFNGCKTSPDYSRIDVIIINICCKFVQKFYDNI
jgi:hypothetical protein